jgi:hypothetical protein
MMRTSRQTPPTRVLLACDPPLLQECLTLMLERLPDVELVAQDAAEVDVVVVSLTECGTRSPVEPLVARTSAVRLVVVDPTANVLRVWDTQQGPSGERELPGDLPTIVEVLQGGRRRSRLSVAESA